MATTTPFGLYKPANGEVGWGTLLTASIQNLNDSLVDVGHHVEAYGAVGEGTTNDTTAFNNTIAAAGWPTSPAHIILGPKRYRINGTWLFDGAGATSTRPIVVHGNGAELYTETDSSNPMVSVTNSVTSTTFVTFNDVSFIPNCDGSPFRTAVKLTDAESTVFNNCKFGGSYALGVEIVGSCNYNRFNSCFFYSLARGVLFTGSGAHTTFTGCHFGEQLAGNPLNWIQSANGASPTDDVAITGCVFRGAGATTPLINIANGNGWEVVGNQFFDCDFEAIYIGNNGSAGEIIVSGNSFKNGKRHDVLIDGARRNIVTSNRFGYREGSTAANTYAAVRVKNTGGGTGGDDNVISNNTSNDTAAGITNVVELDAGCDYCVVTGNIGLAGVQAAGANNVVTGNITH